ncbi:hypothetical protein CPJCM30710_20100 [Clostridium polyendosporum]|uniref:CobW/HypB/UreG nucleotide-binding domain-containing protein n=1 Tax=Clostridium polyendosporum TaxID=69208 RepID=A0A919S0U5_9CLOT|nr:GTP-binding protein [Clostridium polyendosporum]GIM29344.1 hypothetical protein CPJCM30710_20100 [Clostridium polyendosporum]
MFRRTGVEIVTGFLGSGKTSFINSFLKISKKKNEEIIIFQCEKGKGIISEELTSDKNIVVKQFASNYELKENEFLRAVKFYAPNRLIIESNGVCSLDKLLLFLNSKQIKKYVKVTAIITIIDGCTFNMFFKNMASLILPNIQAADLIIVSNCSKISEAIAKDIIDKIKELNFHANILKSDFTYTMIDSLKNCSIIKKKI